MERGFTREGRSGSTPGQHSPATTTAGTHLALASLTRILGLARSSFSRWLCSVNRLSFNSDMDCLCGREFILLF